MPPEKLSQALDLGAQRRKVYARGGQVLLAGGSLGEQLLLRVAQRGRALEVLGVDGGLLVAADLRERLVEVARSGAHAALEGRQAPLDRAEAGNDLSHLLARRPGYRTAHRISRLVLAVVQQDDHMPANPARS